MTDATSGEAVPFANVFVKRSTVGTVTDFEGRYTLVVSSQPDSLSCSSVGYRIRTKRLVGATEATLNFQLEPQGLELGEVVIKPGENPAWPILRQVIARKDSNDKQRLSAYEYESYSRLEIDVNNLGPRFERQRAIKKIRAVMDSIQKLKGEDGKPVMPIFLSETVSVIYKRSNPDKVKEKIVKSKVSGIGIEKTSVLNQMLGSSLQEYNFYKDWLRILNRYFVSPIADGWKFYYEYELKDSTTIGGDFCYRIEYWPKRPQDLAFKGSIWVTKQGWALKQIDATTGDKANINFVDKIRIQQELVRLPEGAWMPAKNRVVIDIDQPTKNAAGMIAKYYSSNRHFLANKPKPLDFFGNQVDTDPGAYAHNDSYWVAARHDSLSPTERNIFKMIDTVRRLPVVRSYVEVANIAINGYKRAGPIDIGPYLYTFGFNNVEGSRFRLGFRTNPQFSRKFTYAGYAAYGTADQRFKYESRGEYLFSRKRWTVVGTRYKEDLELLALYDNSVAVNTLFNAVARLGALDTKRPFYLRQAQTYFSSEVVKGLTLGGSFETNHYQFNTGVFGFTYFPPGGDGAQLRASDFNTTEANVEVRIAPDETFLENQNSRISLGAYKWPIISLRYAQGFNQLALGQFDYKRFQFLLQQWINLGYLGKAQYRLDLGLIPYTLPYPLLRPHLGNQTPFFNASSFNQMQFFEFVSDRWAQVGYQHFFEGAFLNSVPYVRDWNLRLLATSNVLFGGISQANLSLSRGESPTGVVPFHALDIRRPYVEVGYGIENIFRLGRIDFIHRLSYLNQPYPVRPFGVKFSVQFKI